VLDETALRLELLPFLPQHVEQRRGTEFLVVGIPSNLSGTIGTIKVPTTKDTNTRQTTGNNKSHPGRSRKKRPK
jgi:hypothetical protein